MPKMKRTIDRQQQSDMGSGWGHYDLPTEQTLGEVLNDLRKSLHSWGTITIIRENGNIARCFDFDLYSIRKNFYHNLSGWEYNTIVKEIKFSYCFMSEDIEIYLSKHVSA